MNEVQETLEQVEIPTNVSSRGVVSERSRKLIEAIDAGKALKIDGLTKEKRRTIISQLSQHVERNRPQFRTRSSVQNDGSLVVWGELKKPAGEPAVA
jgi:hypothetical protein